MSTPQTPPPGSIRCPRCDAILGPEQDWCLNCGAPARTRLAPRPNWKAPVVVVAILAVLSGVALAVAFVSLTGDDDQPAAATTAVATTPATTPVLPGAQTVPATTAPATTPPATTPPATATTPPATIPASTFTVTTPTITAPTATTP